MKKRPSDYILPILAGVLVLFGVFGMIVSGEDYTNYDSPRIIEPSESVSSDDGK